MSNVPFQFFLQASCEPHLESFLLRETMLSRSIPLERDFRGLKTGISIKPIFIERIISVLLALMGLNYLLVYRYQIKYIASSLCIDEKLAV